MKNILKSAVCAAAILVGTSGAFAQVDNDLMEGLMGRVVGPAAMSGRIAAIDAVESDPNNIVVGAATGGVWISKNGGLNWTPVFDSEECASIGAVAINQNNPDIIWVGTGEGNVRNSTSIGCGMFKSIDGGKTWNKVGLPNSEHINRIALHPTDENIAYAAVLGKLWGDNKERGLFKTTDGGKSWSKIIYVNETTGATDVQMDPSNPNKLFASMWQFRRWPYKFESASDGSGLYVSHDAGESWKQLSVEDGLPKGEIGRSSFAISRSNPNRVYALLESKTGPLVRSDDGGRSWAVVNKTPGLNDRPFYYNEVRVDPNNPDLVYQVGSRVKKSIDGGRNFSTIPAINCCRSSNTIHIDNHDWWINPSNSLHMIDGNDGGLGITHDGGVTWRFVENLPLAQFYHIAVDNDLPYNIYGGLQDNGSWRGPGEVFDNAGIRNLHWQEVGFGDGFDTLPDPTNSRRGLTMSQGGSLTSWNLDTNESRYLRPDGPEDGTELRFNWNAGLAQSPFDANTIYYGSQFVHKSTDRGLTWQIISGDLTTNNPDVQTYRTSGGLTSDVTAAENYTAITSVNPSPVDANVIWVGTDDGRVHVTKDGGTTWDSVEGNLKRGPKGAWVPMIEPSRFDASVAFITMDDHRRGDNAPHAYRMERYGKRWKSITTSDVTGYALSVRQDHVDENLLFLGTEFGLHFSTDAGKSWTKWTAGIPTVSVMDMAIQTRENDLILGTHGRAVFVIDDYSALRGLTEASFNEPLKILSVTDGQQYTSGQTAGTRFPGNGEFRAQNEPYGMLITFMASGDDLKHPDEDKEKLRMTAKRAADKAEKEKAAKNKDAKKDEKKDGDGKKKPDGKVTIKIADASGNTIRTFKRDMHQGINRVVWNLRQDGNHRAPPAKPAKDGTLPSGLEVLPGTYTVTLEYGDNSDSSTAKILVDPRSPYSDEDRAANFAARTKLSGMTKRMTAAITRIAHAQRDLQTLQALIKIAKEGGDEDAFKDISKQVKALEKSLKTAEKSFRVPAKTAGIVYRADKVGSIIGQANFYVGSTEDAPSAAALKQIILAEAALEKAVAAVNGLVTDDVAKLKAAVAEAGIGLLNQTPVSDAE
ncbi:MAG: hypothetical protein COB37_06530 [Kordiimonadales bacterium]|nr:MAG: hypothetical protein COB37_06530 [Kordiimonadales bacterium]